jgi:hypothetical protein
MDSIDVVITWVDSKDPKWIEAYNRHADKKMDMKRFKEIDTLKYIFRGIEKFMPWVRKIHLVTYGHYPEYLNLEHPKLNLVKHEDIFPDKEVLPVFNSCAIEMNLHYITGLSEKFIYFNDDMFVLKALSPNYFFTNGVPNDFFIVRHLFHDKLFTHLLHSEMQIINKHIKEEALYSELLSNTLNFKYGWKSMTKSFMLMFLTKEIPLFTIHHHPQAHLKKNFIEVEHFYKKDIEEVRTNKFRTCQDLSQYIFRFWGLIKNRFYPTRHKDLYYIGVNSLDELKKDIDLLTNKNPAFVCFNEHDNFPVGMYTEYQKIVQEYLNRYLNEKSRFEK